MSTILVNTLTGTSTAGSIAVTGEGNSTTTNLQQGLLKSWARSEADTSLLDSLNLSSNTDNGTGDYTFGFTNAMANTSYSIVTLGNYASITSFDNAEQATGSYNIRIFTRTDSLTNDDTKVTHMVSGDLA